jgi:hypothetical protein
MDWTEWQIQSKHILLLKYRAGPSEPRGVPFQNLANKLNLSNLYYYLNCYVYFGWWNRRFGCETIHPTENFISMNLLQMSCVITYAWSFLTSEVVEAVRGQKHHILAHTLAL